MNDIKVLIIAGGPDINEAFLAELASSCDAVICADSGADHAMELRIVPSRVLGDLDSISPRGLEYLKANNVPIEVFPVEKDMTDSELCLTYAIDNYDPATIIIYSSFKGRFDQLASNVQLALRYSTPDRNIVLTDGDTEVFPLLEGTGRTLQVSGNENISVIPVSRELKMGECNGLYYDLSGLDLHYGSSLSVSNKPSKEAEMISVMVEKGLGYLVISY